MVINLKKIIMVLVVLFIAISCVKSKAYGQITIAIDPGHGGRDGGAFINGIKESDLDLEYGLALEKSLSRDGFLCIMTRTTDVHLPINSTYIKRKDLDERIKIISSCNLFISLHMNSFNDSRYSGPQVFYSSNKQENATLARSITTQLKNDFTVNRSEKCLDTLYLLKNASSSGVIIECGFMSNPQELANLLTENYRNRFIDSIATGIKSYLNSY